MYTLQSKASNAGFAKSTIRKLCLAWLFLLGLGGALTWPSVLFGAEDWVYVVQPGDNLWFLSANLLKDVNHYNKLLQYNNIVEPKPLQPGTELRVPLTWLKRKPAKVKVVHNQGHTEVFRHRKRQAKQLNKGDILGLGDRIRTGPDSNVTLEFADGSTLVVQAQSEMVLDTLAVSATGVMVDTRVRLKRGRAEVEVPSERKPPPNFEIITPESVTSVRGTRFRVEADSERHITLSEVIEGRVEVVAAGISRIVTAGHGIAAQAGKPLMEPRPLLTRPDLSGLPARIETLPTTFDWPPVAGAETYRIQIAPDESFTALVIDTVLIYPNYTLSSLPNGQYALRARGMDEFGLEGLNSDIRFIMDTHPDAPVIVDPEGDESSTETRPEFRWQPVKGATGYRLQLARDWAFKEIILDVYVGATNHYKLPKNQQSLPPHAYFSRVASIDKSGKESPFSTPKVTVVRSPPAIDRPTLSQ
ncbi:MAG: LysM peptidoglycan-binding domain-containing protein [Gammaproteobacteria bacterium]|nr:LysM peptidoglycan-binding domain-containing protein [Gammaproteobacteria bacterium]